MKAVLLLAAFCVTLAITGTYLTRIQATIKSANVSKQKLVRWWVDPLLDATR